MHPCMIELLARQRAGGLGMIAEPRVAIVAALWADEANQSTQKGAFEMREERPMTATRILAASGTNYTAIGIILGIFVPICAAVAAIVGCYYRLQRHRADAVAMAAYRKLAEEAVASQAGLRDQLAKLTEHVNAAGQLMRDVG